MSKSSSSGKLPESDSPLPCWTANKLFDIGKEKPLDRKRKNVLIAVAAMLLVVAAFLLLRRSQPLIELIPVDAADRYEALFENSTSIPMPDSHGTFDNGTCQVTALGNSKAGVSLKGYLMYLSVQRYYRLPTSLFSRFTQNGNYATIWWTTSDGERYDLYFNWDEGFIYDDAHPAVAYRIDGDAQQAFSELCAVISEYGTYTR